MYVPKYVLTRRCTRFLDTKIHMSFRFAHLFPQSTAQSFAKLQYVALRFSHINLTEKKLSYIQEVTGRFSKNPNPGQSCCPSIDSKMKIRQGFLKSCYLTR